MSYLALGVETSLEFWRVAYPANRAPEHPCNLPTEALAAFNQDDVLPLVPAQITDRVLEGCGGKLHVLCFGRKSRRVSCQHVTHLWAAAIPPNSFFRLSESAFVASPEMIFLGSASRLDIASLIALGDELCGLYTFDRNDERGMRKRKIALTSVDRLSAYVGMCARMPCTFPGIRAAQRALGHIVDNSASPMETFDEMTMCLPYRMGGYGLPKPVMNPEIPLGDKAQRIAKQSRCYADMLWRDAWLDVEHQGGADHSSPEDALADRARVNGLQEMGFKVIELTAAQVEDLLAYEYIVTRIAKILGKRIRTDQLGATPARLELRKRLRAWNASYGKICS